MAKATFQISGYPGRNSKIRVDPTTIEGRGGPAYPRLYVPAYIDLYPIDGRGPGVEKHYTLLNGKCSLSVEGVTVSDAISSGNSAYVSSSEKTNSGVLIPAGLSFMGANGIS